MIELSRRQLVTGAATVTAATALPPFVAARAAAPPIGKQAPGIYRYKVGSFELTVVTDGGNNNPLPDNFISAPRADVNAALTADFLPADRVIGAYNPAVVNTGSRLVALDTGLGLGMYQQSSGAVGQYHTNLQAAGIDRNAVDTVIISHFHADHINGLVGPDDKPAFPNAEVLVPAPEWAFWADESNTSKLPEIARPQMPNFKRVFNVLGNKVTKYEGDKELMSGIRSISTPGHTPGHMSLLVSSGDAKMIYQADVTAGPAILFVRNPDWQFVYDTDKTLAVETRKKFYDMAAAEKVLLQGYHFAFPSRGYVEKAGNGYRLVPAPWIPTI